MEYGNKITMNNTILSPDTVFDELTRLFPVVYRALEGACQDTREFFDTQNVPVDAYLAPCLVRHFAKRYLCALGQDADYDEEDIENLANNGLCLAYADYQIRILKSDCGRLPPPGVSRRKQAFYHQQLALLYLDSPNKEPRASKLNLLILWDVDSKYNLVGLSLACPKGGSATQLSVEEYWIEPIPYQTSVSVGEPATPERAEDLPLWLRSTEGDAQQAQ